MGVLKRNPIRFKPGKCCEVIAVCCMLHNFCRKVPLNYDDEEEASSHSNNADDMYQDGNETEEGLQKPRRIC